MSLIGADGKPIQFDSKPATAAAPAQASPFQLKNSFSFDMPASPAAAAAASGMSAAAATSSPAAATAASLSMQGAFSSQPVDLGAGHSGLVFAPSAPQRKKADAVAIDFSEFENDIADMEKARRAEFEAGLADNAARIAAEKRGTAALPSQIGDSALFHQLVVKQYGKVHHLEEVDPKKAFMSRKAKARDARKAKKAEDKADQMEARGGGAIRKTKTKNRAKSVY